MAANKFENFLLTVTVIVLGIDFLLALLIGLVLPLHFINVNYVPYDNGSYRTRCDCDKRFYVDIDDNDSIPFTDVYHLMDPIRESVSSRAANKDTTGENPIDLPNPKKKIRIDEYPFLISLTAPESGNSQSTIRTYVGMGIILSKDWALTCSNALPDKAQWYNIIVRSGSASWAGKDGYEHRVEYSEPAPINGVVLIKVNPSFGINNKKGSRVMEIQYPLPTNTKHWDEAVIVGWDTKIHKETTRQANSTNLNEEEMWSLTACPDVITKSFCMKIDVDKQLPAKPLVNICHKYLLGLAIGKDGTVLNLNQASIMKFIIKTLSATKENKQLSNYESRNTQNQKQCLSLYKASCYSYISCGQN